MGSNYERTLDELNAREMHQVFARFVIVRFVAAPFILVLLLWMILDEHSIWRGWILGAVSVVGISQAVVFHRRRRAHRLAGTPLQFRWWEIVILPVLTLGSVIVATGGFDSPMLPIMVPICFFFGTQTRPPHVRLLAMAFIWVIWILAFMAAHADSDYLLPAVLGGERVRPQPASLIYSKAVGLTLVLAWAGTVSSMVRKVSRGTTEKALIARDEALRHHAEHTRALTALSGELAHELKNPLASVKGLAALLAKDLSGRGAERLSVLRREVDRMEETLHGFLNFSRPLLPLREERVRLLDIAEAVAALHEGMAHQRGVTVEVLEDPPTLAFCDPRKVKQILMNLLQNALDATAPGSTVEIVVTPSMGGGAMVEVKDRGPGLAPGIRNRLFEAGITTKDSGSGMGLAIARGLARQHGGELTLEDRQDGGCVAVLSLPSKPPSDRAEVARA